ncbi:carbonic anhydrase 6-like [Dreissena polymorpha]|uniref:carbonic anhydrase 6-like n=1 Tax=Dreissena polymorpha TaxID=45954 RepID=UPI002263E783|nr:carbonic anhydrase 6-like [Dreissena polymorpha]
MAPGSEHTVNGRRYDREIHFVLFNSKYGTLENAENKTDGIAVLAFLSSVPLSITADSTVNARINLNTFFDRQCEFFTYRGSKTTPQCFQSVQWVIFREPIPALESTGDFDARYGNYRISQPLNDRIVEANFMPPGYTRPPTEAQFERGSQRELLVQTV